MNAQGQLGNSTSYATGISADGRYVAFYGYASNLAKEINEARQNGDSLIAVERDVIPTGQMMHLDPRQIESVKDS